MAEEALLKIQQSWQSFSWTMALLVFCAYFVIDILWARYTYAVVNMKAVPAATIGSTMYFLLAFGVLNYTKNFLYLIPLVIRSWLGTYLVVKWERAKKSKNKATKNSP